jgi:3-oxoacyl-[acyl-carrier-protein] synthase-3
MSQFSKIVGTGSFLPSQRVTNEALVAQLALSGVETSND